MEIFDLWRCNVFPQEFTVRIHLSQWNKMKWARTSPFRFHNSVVFLNKRRNWTSGVTVSLRLHAEHGIISCPHYPSGKGGDIASLKFNSLQSWHYAIQTPILRIHIRIRFLILSALWIIRRFKSFSACLITHQVSTSTITACNIEWFYINVLNKLNNLRNQTSHRICTRGH